MHKYLIFILMALVTGACGQKSPLSWTDEETIMIFDADTLMRVLTVDHEEDSLFLRQSCSELSAADISSDIFCRLSRLMVSTVIDEGGVGIAGPQVGIGRRVVAVQRFDKEGEPFEVYPNIRITAFNGEKEAGGEGCLSVPGKRGSVMRYRDIDIAYTSMATLRDTTETIQGFTAVIFQHETDHLDGIIYTDRAESVSNLAE